MWMKLWCIHAIRALWIHVELHERDDMSRQWDMFLGYSATKSYFPENVAKPRRGKKMA